MHSTVLVSLSNDNNIRSWSIYNDKDGSISLRIKFVPEEESISRDRQTNSHCRRKSERQAMRDRQRCQQWRASAQGSRNSETRDHQGSSHSVNAATPVVSPDYEGHNMQTRSKGSPIEIARTDPCEMKSFILDPAAEPFVCDTPSVIENKSLIDQDTADDSSMINVPWTMNIHLLQKTNAPYLLIVIVKVVPRLVMFSSLDVQIMIVYIAPEMTLPALVRIYSSA